MTVPCARLHIILGHAFFIPLGGGYTNAGAYALDDRTHVQNYVSTLRQC
jgi:hypothetical protein